jgi:uncharacterized membrane protein
MSAGTFTESYPPEPPTVAERNFWVGVRMAIATDAFFMLGWGFAFIYLRSLNSNHLFRGGPHDNPSTALGVAILAATLVAVPCAALAATRAGSANASGFKAASIVGLAAILVAIVLQCVQFGVIGLDEHVYFGYKSVFLGWTFFMIVHWVASLTWLEIMWAEAARNARGASQTTAMQRIAPNAAAFAAWWYYLSGVGVLMFILLYLVK